VPCRVFENILVDGRRLQLLHAMAKNNSMFIVIISCAMMASASIFAGLAIALRRGVFKDLFGSTSGCLIQNISSDSDARLYAGIPNKNTRDVTHTKDDEACCSYCGSTPGCVAFRRHEGQCKVFQEKLTTPAGTPPGTTTGSCPNLNRYYSRSAVDRGKMTSYTTLADVAKYGNNTACCNACKQRKTPACTGWRLLSGNKCQLFKAKPGETIGDSNAPTYQFMESTGWLKERDGKNIYMVFKDDASKSLAIDKPCGHDYKSFYFGAHSQTAPQSWRVKAYGDAVRLMYNPNSNCPTAADFTWLQPDYKEGGGQEKVRLGNELASDGGATWKSFQVFPGQHVLQAAFNKKYLLLHMTGDMNLDAKFTTDPNLATRFVFVDAQ